MELSPEQQDAARRQALERIDQHETAVREMMANPGPLIRDGQVVTDPAIGEPVPNRDIVAWAEKELAAIRRQRDQILGLEPTRVHQLIVPPGTPPDEIKRLAVEIALNDARQRDAKDSEDDDDPAA